jgi:hypothetical protein
MTNVLFNYSSCHVVQLQINMSLFVKGKGIREGSTITLVHMKLLIVLYQGSGLFRTNALFSCQLMLSIMISYIITVTVAYYHYNLMLEDNRLKKCMMTFSKTMKI